MSSLKYWLWLSELQGLRSQTRLALLRHFETPENVFYADKESVLLTEGITREQAALLENRDLTPAERILSQCHELGIRILTLQDAEYPDRLKGIYDPPFLLYAKGRMMALDEEVTVTVVGTRKCTPYGVASAEKLGFGLAKGRAVVVSGLARGIDAAATRGALLAGGSPVGVVGNGLDVLYPYENRGLYEDVAAVGLLLSEYPPGSEPLPAHFPVRNRIMSGLSLATLVVEAPARSGALITANTALEQGRDVFAVPGPIDAPKSVGCNCLIRDGAGLVTESADILRNYQERFPDKLRLEESRKTPAPQGYESRQKAKEESPPLPPSFSLSDNHLNLTDDQILLLRMLTGQPQAVDDLAEKAQISVRRVMSALTVLEIEKLVIQHGGKAYSRCVEIRE